MLVDMLVPGKRLGDVVRVPELLWSAQTIPHLDYRLEASDPGAMLAGGQLDGVMRGRRRLRGQTPVDEAQAAAGPALQNVAFAPSRNLGDVCGR
ncbi:hypothetical protein THIX_60209 [Thiomonas sp. X19]|nr:hypothetical protein THIX_60209 [Thiomonas sp. X19]